MGDAYKERAERFRTLLEPLSKTESGTCSAVIDVARVQSMCFYGIPDEAGFRPRAWKLLLGYLPPDKRAWKSSLQQSRENYYSFIRDLISTMPETLDAPAADSEGEITSIWADYQAENVTLEQIDNDVRRTLPEIDFFQRTVTPTPLSPLSPPFESVLSGSAESSQEKPRIVPEAENKESAAASVADGVTETGSLSPLTIGVGAGPRESQTGSPMGDRPKRPITNVLGLTLGVPRPTYAPVHARRNLFRRIARIHPDSGTRKHQEEILVPAGGGQVADARAPNAACPEPSWSAPGTNGADADGSAVRLKPRDPLDTDFHWEAVERILYLYAKLNPGVGYVQGMNELLAPIYFCLANDPEDDSRAHAEADSFHVFTVLMSRCRNSFLRSLDTDKNLGIGALMRRVDDIVRSSDPELWQRLADQSVVPEYYSFRWLTTLCAREFELPGVLRLWDSVLADHEFLIAFCAAMVLFLRDEILAADYAQCIQLLQNYPVKDDISPLLAKAYELHEGRPRCERGNPPALGNGEGQKDAPPVRSSFTWGSRRRDAAEGVCPERRSKPSPFSADKGDRNGKLMTRFQKWMPSIMSTSLPPSAEAAVEPSRKLRQIGLPGGVGRT